MTFSFPNFWNTALRSRLNTPLVFKHQRFSNSLALMKSAYSKGICLNSGMGLPNLPNYALHQMSLRLPSHVNPRFMSAVINYFLRYLAVYERCYFALGMTSTGEALRTAIRMNVSLTLCACLILHPEETVTVVSPCGEYLIYYPVALPPFLLLSIKAVTFCFTDGLLRFQYIATLMWIGIFERKKFYYFYLSSVVALLLKTSYSHKFCQSFFFW